MNKKDQKYKKEDSLFVDGSFDDVLKASIPKSKEKVKKKEIK